MSIKYTHTDMVLELQEDIVDPKNYEGIRMEKRIDRYNRLQETVITIYNEKGEKALGRKQGVYITLEAKRVDDKEIKEAMSHRVAFHLRNILKDKSSFLCAGLGNELVTPDKLGPFVVDQLVVTNHLEYPRMRSMAVKPGVMAQTGLETKDILESIVKKFQPEALIAVDALAAREFDRLCTTIQISETGITPGSGVRNHRREISEETMGIPVIAIGTPTVISIPAIAEHILSDVYPGEKIKKNEIIEQLEERLFDFFVTPKDIDETMVDISDIIAGGINQIISH